MSGEGMTGEGSMALTRLRQIASVLAAIFLIVQIVLRGVDLLMLALIAALILMGLALQAIELKTVRPAKNYLRAALASAVLALLFVAMPLMLGANLWIGLILWAGVSVAGFAWAVHYERTEPR